MEEMVVLVDEQNNVLGTTPKATVHTHTTSLHRGFSLFVFNSQGLFLMTQRARSKKTFAGVWTNTVCGHPGPNEEPIDAARRRIQEEMGMGLESLSKVCDYRYTFPDASGIVENEICPVFMGTSNQEPVVNPEEIEGYKWIEWKWFMKDIAEHPEIYSPWCREEAVFVDKIIVSK